MSYQLNPLTESLTGLNMLMKADYHEKRMRNNRFGNSDMIKKIQKRYTPGQLKALLEKSKNPKARFVARKLDENMTDEQYTKILNKYVMSITNLSIISPFGLTRARKRRIKLHYQDPNNYLSKTFKDRSLKKKKDLVTKYTDNVKKNNAADPVMLASMATPIPGAAIVGNAYTKAYSKDQRANAYNEIIDHPIKSIAKAPIVLPQVAAKTALNVPKATYETGKQLAHKAVHPIRTVKGIKKSTTRAINRFRKNHKVNSEV